MRPLFFMSPLAGAWWWNAFIYTGLTPCADLCRPLQGLGAKRLFYYN